MRNHPFSFPDILLERYQLGELPPELREEMRRRLESDPILRQRLEAIAASDRALRDRLPPLAAITQSPSRSAVRPSAPPARIGSPRRRALKWAAVPAFASLLLISVLAERHLLGPIPSDADVGNLQGTEMPVDPEIRLKGLEAGLAIYRKTRSGKAELLPPRSAARAGDTLQIFYQAYRELHGVIFSVDGSGALTLHLPEAAGPAARLEPGALRPLPHAYLLDKAPRLERFYLITSASPFAVDSLLALARPALTGGLSDTLRGLPGEFRQYSYTLLKPDRPALEPKQGGKP